MGLYWLLQSQRRAAPRRSRWRGASFETIRRSLVKIAVRVAELKGKIKLAFRARVEMTGPPPTAVRPDPTKYGACFDLFVREIYRVLPGYCAMREGRWMHAQQPSHFANFSGLLAGTGSLIVRYVTRDDDMAGWPLSRL